MEKKKRTPIRRFQDLEIYQRLYAAMKIVLVEIVPRLPREEKFDLADQLRRSSKASPVLIAEGFAKRYQIRQWRKYLDDTIGEINETIHHLSVAIDIYRLNIDVGLCENLINEYNIANKQIYHLKQSWKDFHSRDLN